MKLSLRRTPWTRRRKIGSDKLILLREVDQARSSTLLRNILMGLRNPRQPGSGEWPHPRTGLWEISSTGRISSKCRILKNFHPAFATIVDSPGIMQMSARNPNNRSPSSRIITPDPLTTTPTRSRSFKWSKANWISWVTSLTDNTYLVRPLLSNLEIRFFLRGVGSDAPSF
jgi:hypothetical protein